MKIGIQERYRVVVPDRYLKTRFVDDQVTIHRQGHTVVSTDMAMELLEGDRAAVIYVPVADVQGARLLPSETRYRCRWKGEAIYHDVHLPDGTVLKDAAWAYPSAPDELALLRSQISFDTGLFQTGLDSRRLNGK